MSVLIVISSPFFSLLVTFPLEKDSDSRLGNDLSDVGLISASNDSTDETPSKSSEPAGLIASSSDSTDETPSESSEPAGLIASSSDSTNETPSESSKPKTRRRRPREKAPYLSPEPPEEHGPATREEWLGALAGWLSSDGHFSKYELQLCLNSRDIGVAEAVRDNIFEGRGRIYVHKNQNSVTYCIAYSEAPDTFRELRDHIQHEDKRRDFDIRCAPRIGNVSFDAFDATKLSFKALLWHSFCFSELDGALSTSYKHQHKLCRRPTFDHKATISQKRPELLMFFVKHCGGAIAYRKRSDSFEYYTSSHADAVRFALLFDGMRYHGCKKAKRPIWREGLIRRQEDRCRTPEDQESCADLDKQLRNLNSQQVPKNEKHVEANAKAVKRTRLLAEKLKKRDLTLLDPSEPGSPAYMKRLQEEIDKHLAALRAPQEGNDSDES